MTDRPTRDHPTDADDYFQDDDDADHVQGADVRPDAVLPIEEVIERRHRDLEYRGPERRVTERS